MFAPGDILLYEPNAFTFQNLIPEGIRLVEGNKVVHVAVYIGLASTGFYIIEAMTDGVHLKVIPDLINRSNGFKLYGTASLPNQKFNFTDLWSEAHKYDDKPYGYLTDGNLLLQHGMSRLFPNRPWQVWFKSKKGFICSELALLIISKFCNNFTFPKVPALTEPDDFLKSPWVVTLI